MTVLEVLSDAWATVQDLWSSTQELLAPGFTFFFTLGISGALVTAAIAYVRDRASVARLRRSDLSSAQISAVANKLQSRLHPSDTGEFGDQSDSELMLSSFRLTTAMPGRRNRILRDYVFEVERVSRFGQPAPNSAHLLKDLVMQLGNWARKPSAMRRSLRVAAKRDGATTMTSARA